MQKNKTIANFIIHVVHVPETESIRFLHFDMKTEEFYEDNVPINQQKRVHENVNRHLNEMRTQINTLLEQHNKNLKQPTQEEEQTNG